MATIELPVTPAPKTMTIEEFLALPEDGVARELIFGEVREKGMTVRNEVHSRTMASTARHLGNWAACSSAKTYEVLCGEVGFILDEVDRLVVGVDVAVNLRHREPVAGLETSMARGAPHVAVEILSPSDVQKEIHDKVRLYLSHGTSVVWIVDPDDQTVRLYRRETPPQFFSSDQVLSCEQELPGFSLKVSDLF